VDAGPRAGITINGDQWLVGGHLRASVPCLGGLGYGPTLTLGLGGNYLTLKSSGRLDYLIWFDRAKVFGIYPAVGASALFYIPVGGFARFCNRTGLYECYGKELGLEVGVGLRYRWLGADAFIGFGGLPVLTIMVGAWFPFAHPEGS
jgi:hypothetical protein